MRKELITIVANMIVGLTMFVDIAASAQVADMRLSELTSNAMAIIHGKVEHTESKWVEDARGRHIYTRTTIDVSEVLKGYIGQNPIVMSVVGGTVGDTTEYVSPSYSFDVGEEVILFMGSHPDELVGGYQGKLTVYDKKIYYRHSEISVDQFIQGVKELVQNPSFAPSFEMQAKKKVGLIIDTTKAMTKRQPKNPVPKLEAHPVK